MKTEAQKVIDNLYEEDEETIENVVPPTDIFAFNESRSCADLKRMYDKKQIDISPDFQREQVWNQPSKARFLDSLLKNLPIPSMCISLDISSQKRVVIDGLQRISTIVEFLDAVENDKDLTLSPLDDIDDRLSGKSIKQIKEYSPDVIGFIENVSIPVTVLRCDLSKENHMEYIFTIFHRLNTGGTKLNNQEIRNCIFNGKFNDMLFECSYEKSKELEFLLGKKNSRFAFEEFILRFFAFQDKLDNYNGKLTSFLNEYMKNNRKLSEYEIFVKKELFIRTVEVLHSKIMKEVRFSKVILEALLYGVGKNLDKFSSKSSEDFNSLYQKMLDNTAFKSSELQGGLMQQNKVKARLNSADDIFSE